MKRSRMCTVVAGALLACSAVVVDGPSAWAQPHDYSRPLYVSFDNAPVYDSANYMSTIIGKLRLGDSVWATGKSGRFLSITFGRHTGYVLETNLSARKPGGKRARGKDASSGSRRADSVHAAAPRPDTLRVISDSIRTAPVRSLQGGKEGASPAGAAPASPKSNTAKSATTQQCRALTKAGKQCSRMAGDSSGYCWQHRKK